MTTTTPTVTDISTTTPSVAVPPRKKVATKVSPATLKKLNRKAKQASAKLAAVPTTEVIQKHAAEGIANARAILGKDPQGKWSPVGHKMGFQNGEFDLIILNAKKPDFAVWVSTVARANCKSKKTAPSDIAGLIKRLGSHLKTLSGQKGDNLRRALKRVGKEEHHDEIASAMAPVELLFSEYAGAVKY